MRRPQRSPRPRTMGGFSLIEVMIALLVLAFGLLGLALLQTMNLRYTQAANQRTQAVNLANELMDMMRSNRSEMGRYALASQDLSSVTVPTGGCLTQGTMGSANNKARWMCQAREALGPDATVAIDADQATGDVEVQISWTESNVAQSNPGGTALSGSGRIEMETRL